ncbi:unnamed protein product [Cladocopium goreaui]|uniref:C3H1-type domain-containing protein n=1 Tax=Cladocopium goreaui TaxID=2562237 RepID=A0A9P1D683_9DINO|nr:unnamed protein product [Cladocopium goreaui]
MSLVDSNAVFESRALAIGISQDTVNALGLRGWVTHATFAFSAPHKKEAEPKRTREDPASNKKNAAEAAKLKRLRRTPMPKQLRGGTPCDDNGKPYCFAFNLGSCQNGDDCKKGMHLCCKKGCGKKHSYVSAHKGS